MPQATWVRPPSRDRLHRARRCLQLATSLVFIVAPFVDILRFDLANSSLILFETSFSLGELSAVYVIILAFILVVFAGALLYGRIYCGWMCPQTTLSEVIGFVERWVCKGRKESFPCKYARAAAALGMSAFVAANLVAYFLDPAQRLAPPATAWIGFGATWLVICADLFFLGHRFCVGVCPYGILQNIVQDSRTLGVSLDPARRGECTNCLLCVRACFMGVDIREQAFDTRCLNCGDCISATRLAKRCPTDPLIRFRWGTAPSTWPTWLRKAGISDARRAVVAGATVAVILATAAMLAGRTDLEARIAAQFEQATLDRSGRAHNVYRLTVRNRLRHSVSLRLEPQGLPGLSIESSPELSLGPGEETIREVRLVAPVAYGESNAYPVVLRLAASSEKYREDLAATFFVPSRR
jgi:polyferredoxin